jgi:hypothetical protein
MGATVATFLATFAKAAIGDKREKAEKLAKAIKAKDEKAAKAILTPDSGSPSTKEPKAANEGDMKKMKEETNPEELNEALETIETLKKDISETNLLNAKLLYVNKIFKANNLTESQKVNTITAFDKAETVKEVKLVFETISQGLDKTASSCVNENKGFASKAAGVAPKTITEAVETPDNSWRDRMQVLAGIKKPN